MNRVRKSFSIDLEVAKALEKYRDGRQFVVSKHVNSILRREFGLDKPGKK